MYLYLGASALLNRAIATDISKRLQCHWLPPTVTYVKARIEQREYVSVFLISVQLKENANILKYIYQPF